MPEPLDHPGIQRVRDAAERKGVTLDIRVFDESTHTAEEAAATVDAELGQIVKSLVFVAPAEDGGARAVLCLVSGPNRVDPARLAAVTGEPDIRRATAREAQELTGFSIGGIPPFGHIRPVRAVMDPDLGRVPGRCGPPPARATAVFPVPPGTLRILPNATVAPITEERRAADMEAEALARSAHEREGAGASNAGRDAGGSARAAGSPSAAPPRDATVGYPGRSPRALALGRQRPGRGGLRPVGVRRHARGPGPLVSPSPEELCRAELRIDGPAGAWTVRLASTISDEPAGLLWDEPALLVVKYGFHAWGLESRTGSLRWSHRSASPVLVVLGSPRLPHVLVQAEIETFAIEADGTVGWRIAHSDVVTAAALVGGRLVLTSFTGQATAIDPLTGRVAPS